MDGKREKERESASACVKKRKKERELERKTRAPPLQDNVISSVGNGDE